MVNIRNKCHIKNVKPMVKNCVLSIVKYDTRFYKCRSVWDCLFSRDLQIYQKSCWLRASSLFLHLDGTGTRSIRSMGSRDRDEIRCWMTCRTRSEREGREWGDHPVGWDQMSFWVMSNSYTMFGSSSWEWWHVKINKSLISNEIKFDKWKINKLIKQVK